ncbi:hypothetical protein CMV_020827 [Castanea mollissima]|uniref:Protein kinase domain-containing protein n=1 Tax=Castanea mollissima TaxID=60419 RepID=A0A8J4VFG5_9ROSI|nr:hypothetical protein CMV_020827 [Castanea mollissima]
MFGSIVPPETLQLGSGYQGLGLRESRGYGGVGTGKRERFDFEKRKPSRGRASASTHTYRRWWCLSSASQPLVAAELCSNEFVLKNIFCFNPNCNQVCYVMEHYEQNFKQWLQENYLSDQQGKNLNPKFLQILRDVLRGIDYIHHVKKRCHGKLIETNIVIMNGQAKITGMVNNISKTYLDDYSDHKHLATIVRRSFDTEQHDIPTELKLFLTYISKTEPSRLLNIENHPIFLSPLQRLSYRVIAQTFLYFGKSKKVLCIGTK